MIISASSPNPVRPIKSTVNLTCTVYVELSPLKNISVMLDIALTGITESDGFTAIDTSQLILENSTTYTSRATISSLGRNESGNYTCTAGLSFISAEANLFLGNSSAQMSSSIQVTTGETWKIIYTSYAHF